MRKVRVAAIIVALAAVALSLLNASWIAPAPAGQLILVAHHGVAQQPADGTGCPARRVKTTDHVLIDDTLHSMAMAFTYGAGAVAVDVQRTSDGAMVVFQDETLDCRTNGHGPVSAHSLAQLKALDIGYGYSADGGKTFPLRGRGVGGMATVEEVLREYSTRRFLFSFKGKDPRAADALAAAFARAGGEIDGKYGFFGDSAVTTRMKALAPAAWTASDSQGGACLGDYLKLGWSGYMPPSCKGATVTLPLEGQWKLWGWPKRFLTRMAGADAKVLMVAEGKGAAAKGLTEPEQLDDVPHDFRGYLLIDDFYTVGRSVQR
jgi:glycerophosphoryl diester phosphodiesterase